jgi:sarcosine oxidase subunit beta
MRTRSICVVGAGVTGLSIAYHLASAGASDVLVVDRVGVGSGASGIQPGGVRQQWGSDTNCVLARESFGFYSEVTERLELRVPARLDPCGYLFVACTPETMEGLDRNRKLQNAHGVPSQRLTAGDAAALVPGLDSSEIVGAVYCAEDGYIDRPQSVVAGFADAAVRLGVSVSDFHVTGLRREGHGWELSGPSGETILSDRVVVAAGYDTPGIFGSLGVHIPIRKEARHLFYSDPIRERILEPLVVSPDLHLAAKQLADGSVLASDLSATGDVSQAGVWLEKIRAGSRALLPILEYVDFPHRVEGYYDLTPDSQPIVGPVPGHAGLSIAAGLSGRGFMMAPGIGRRLANSLLTETEDEILSELTLARFENAVLRPELQVV